MAAHLEGIILGALILSLGSYLLSRLALRNRPCPRRVTLGVSVVCLGWVIAMFLGGMFPGAMPFLVPYQHLGTYQTTDTEGRPATVDVYSKHRSNMIPPGVRPRIRLKCRTAQGSDSLTVDRGWRFGVGPIRPVDGGIEIFSSYGLGYGGGDRYVISGDSIELQVAGILGALPAPLPKVDEEVTPEVKELLEAIHRVPHIRGGGFNPTPLVQVVNALQAAGPDRAAEALRTYHRVQFRAHGGPDSWMETETDRLLLVMRLLFVPGEEPKPYPPISDGLPPMAGKVSLAQHPTYPLVIFDGHPFLLAPYQGRYAHNMKTDEDPIGQLDYYLEHFAFRSEPITPVGSPLEAFRKLEASPLWEELKASQRRHFYLTEGGLRMQVLYSVSTLTPTTAREYNALTSGKSEEAEPVWQKRVAEMETLTPSWNRDRQDFKRSPETPPGRGVSTR